MKKQLFAMIAATIVGSAWAQNSVTLYGQIDEGYLNSRVSGNPTLNGSIYKNEHVRGFDGGITGTNRFGIRVDEDLNGGARLKAQVELKFDHDEAEHIRQAWVGIEHPLSMSETRLGHFYTKTHDYISANNPSQSSVVPGNIGYDGNKLPTFDKTDGIRFTVGRDGQGIHATYGRSKAKEDDVTQSRFYELAAEGTALGAFTRVAYGNRRYGLSGSGAAETVESLYASFGYQLDGRATVTYAWMGNRVSGQLGDYGGKATANQHQLSANIGMLPNTEGFGSYVYGVGNASNGYVNISGLDNDVIYGGRYHGYQVGLRQHLSKRTNVYMLYGHQNSHVDKDNSDLSQDAFGVGLKHSF